MFNHSTPSTGQNNQRSADKETLAKIAAVVATATLGSALALAAPLTASADTPSVSYGSGQFLAGSIAGVNLAKLAAVEAASAQNNGGQSMQVSRDPLGVSALGATVIHRPAGIQLNLGQIIDLGAANQYAQASNDGSSMASSGAINNDGGIGVGKVGAVANGSAAVDLNSLLGSRFASVLTDLKLGTKDVAAQATSALKKASGSYTLADLTLSFTSPAIANLSGKVAQALGPIDGQIAGLDGPNGQLAQAVNGVVTKINPVLGLTGAGATVSANVSVDVNAAVQPLLTGSYGNGAVSFNLQTGAVTVNLAQLLGGNINNEPVGTEVLSDRVVSEVLHGITGTITTLVDQIVAKARDTLNNAAVNVDAAVNVSTPQAPILGQTCVQSGAGTSGTGGLLGGLLGGSGSPSLGGLLCTKTSKLLPDLKTALAVHVHGTVAQLVSGSAPAASASLALLGVPVTVNLGGIVTGIGTQLTDHLLDGTSGESGLGAALTTDLLDPAVAGLLGSGSSVENALTQAVSVRLNNQSTATTGTGSTFTETALAVSILPDGTNSAATINLANATVGPNATTIVPGDPGVPANPGTPSDPGSPSTPGSPAIPTSLGHLAFTGVGIAPLVSAILALLAAGAYLVREGYRRNGRRQIP